MRTVRSLIVLGAFGLLLMGGSAIAESDAAMPNLQPDLDQTDVLSQPDGISPKKPAPRFFTNPLFKTDPADDPPCPIETIFGQTPQGSSAGTSDDGPTQNYLRYDNFAGLTTDITGIRFYGINAWHDGSGWNTCTEDPMDFTIAFYADVAGAPGAMVAINTYTLTAVNTGLLYSGYAIYQYDASFAPVSLTSGWVSIQGTGGSTCWFLWMSADPAVDYDGTSWFWDGAALITDPWDYSMCLFGSDCSWTVTDPHKMHFPQLPDETGWDVREEVEFGHYLADDWQCSETGWVTDIHWWGSWKDGIEGIISAVEIGIFSDIPDPDGDGPLHSRPGNLLWSAYTSSEYTTTAIDPGTWEGWYDPISGDILPQNHTEYFQYDLCIPPEADWFYQEAGTIYWVSILAHVEDPATEWGWKSTQDHFNDDAVISDPYTGDPATDVWVELHEPVIPPLATSEPPSLFGLDPSGLLVVNSAPGAYGGDIFHYYPASEWWNAWYYDHPFDTARYKEFYIEFWIDPFIGVNMQVEVAINWATAEWSLDQPPSDSIPPLPGTDETLYIGRQTLIAGGTETIGFHQFDWAFLDYNPEWVSIDIRGTDFIFQTFRFDHTCIDKDGVSDQSLDLAFVITGEAPTGACCLPDGSCIDGVSPDDCAASGGTYQGDGTGCATVTCPLPTGACCLADGTCVDAVSAADCAGLGGTYQGDGSDCSTVTCPQPTGACCVGDVCSQQTAGDCAASGGTYHGDGVGCTPDPCACWYDGDIDGNGTIMDFADLFYIANYVTGGGTAPIPLYRADADGDGDVDMFDVSLVECYIFGPGISCFTPYGGLPHTVPCETVFSCCIGTMGSVQLVPQDVGDLPCDPNEQLVDVEDLTNMIDHLFIGFDPLCCYIEGDIHPRMIGDPMDGIVDNADLTGLIDHLFINFPVLPICP